MNYRIDRQYVVDWLKRLYGVEQDQQLARILGATKSAVANWRRRGDVPAWVAARYLADFPAERQLVMAEDEGMKRWALEASDVYAVVAEIIERRPLPRWPSSDPESTVLNAAFRGKVFADLVDAVSRHIALKVQDSTSVEVIARCLADFESGAIEGVERTLLRQVPPTA